VEEEEEEEEEKKKKKKKEEQEEVEFEFTNRRSVCPECTGSGETGTAPASWFSFSRLRTSLPRTTHKRVISSLECASCPRRDV